MNPIRVLIVDDSLVARGILGQIVSSDSSMRVVGFAANGLAALEFLQNNEVDVVTIDIEMPKLDGLGLLRAIMNRKPVAVVMIAGATEDQAMRTMTALALGAIDFVEKIRGTGAVFDQYCDRVLGAIRVASQAHPRANLAYAPRKVSSTEPSGMVDASIDLIAIGASTGGTEAIRNLLMQLPERCPPVVVALHMPAAFTASFAQRLDSLLDHRAQLAVDSEPLRDNTIYIAPGGQNLSISRSADNMGYTAHLAQARATDLYRPSVDRLFDSASKAAKSRLVAFILTGMGRDGSVGAKAVRSQGGRVFAQSEKSCVVYGMPRWVVQEGSANAVLPIDSITSTIVSQPAGLTQSGAHRRPFTKNQSGALT
jgi:two-component system, chemotaxis family, protein-glutamate methylesterase/glutaminase